MLELFSWQIVAFTWLSVLSLGFLFLSVASWTQRRTHRHRTLEKKLSDLSIDLVQCLDQLDKLSVVAKKKYQRDATRESRKNRANGIPDPERDPEGWKAHMRREHALGRLK